MENPTTSIRIELDFFLNTALKLKAKDQGITKAEFIKQLIQENIAADIQEITPEQKTYLSNKRTSLDLPSIKSAFENSKFSKPKLQN